MLIQTHSDTLNRERCEAFHELNTTHSGLSYENFLPCSLLYNSPVSCRSIKAYVAYVDNNISYKSLYFVTPNLKTML